MEGLKSYFSMIDPQLLNHVKGETGRIIRLFREQEYLSEAAFIQRICGQKHDRAYYQELKSRTLKILQALAIVSAPKGNSLVKKKYDFCQKKFIIGQKFLNEGQRVEGLRLIKQAHRIAVEFDFVHLACELSSILYHQYIYYQPNPKLAALHRQQSEQYIQDYKAEKGAAHHYFHLVGLMRRKIEEEDYEKAITEVELLEGSSLKYTTYSAMIKVLYGFHQTNYRLIIESCMQALKKLEGRKGVFNSHLQFFYSSLGIAQMATKGYQKAEESLIAAGNLAPARSVNHFHNQLYRTINALHSGDYHQAYTLYRQNRYCKYDEIRQQFTLIEAYMCFLAHMGYLQLDKPFRIGKYLNQTLKEQNDKQGNNIIVLIAELLYYLARNRGKFIDRVEAINSYSYRHLTSKETRRAKRFIHILCMLPRANFNSIALERKAQRSIQYIKENPIYMGENVAIEIIPFEVLLDMILVYLQRKVA